MRFQNSTATKWLGQNSKGKRGMGSQGPEMGSSDNGASPSMKGSNKFHGIRTEVEKGVQIHKEPMRNLDSMEEDAQRSSPMEIEPRPAGITGFDSGKLKKIQNNEETNVNTLSSDREEAEPTEQTRQKTQKLGSLPKKEGAGGNARFPEESDRHANSKAGRSNKGKTGGRRSPPTEDCSARTKSATEGYTTGTHGVEQLPAVNGYPASGGTRGRSRSPRKDESVRDDSHGYTDRSRNSQALQHLENRIGGSTSTSGYNSKDPPQSSPQPLIPQAHNHGASFRGEEIGGEKAGGEPTGVRNQGAESINLQVVTSGGNLRKTLALARAKPEGV